jgi:hypothetical protein
MKAKTMEQEELRQEALTWPDRARDLTVNSVATCAAASEQLLGIKGLRLKIEETLGPAVRKAYEAHKAIVMVRKSIEDPLIEAETILKLSLSVYEIEQRKMAEEEQRTERERQEREAQRERDAELSLAKAEGASKAELKEIAARPLPPPVTIPQKPWRAPGITMRDNWKVVIEDKMKLIRYCATNPDHHNLLEPNLTALNAMARALKGVLNLPGVRVVKEPVVAAGGFKQQSHPMIKKSEQ